MSTHEPPFRWDLSRREQLGALVRGEPAAAYPEFLDDLRACCARVLAHGGDGTLVFIGRSPESLFDYLGGALADTPWRDRLILLNLSIRHDPVAERAGLDALRTQFRGLGLDPAGIASAPRPVVLVDLVSSGTTLGRLQELLVEWAGETGVDRDAVRRRLRFVGVVVRDVCRPRHWLWRRRVEWAAGYRPGALRTVAVPWRLWDYLGNRQSKVSRWNPPARWGERAMAAPPREAEHAEALRLALRVHEHGRSAEERERFTAALAAQPEMRHRWLRRLVSALRGGRGTTRRSPRWTAGHRQWVRTRAPGMRR